MSNHNAKALAWYHRNKDTAAVKKRVAERMASYKVDHGYTLKRSHDKQRDSQRFDPLVNWGSSKGRHKGAMVHFSV